VLSVAQTAAPQRFGSRLVFDQVGGVRVARTEVLIDGRMVSLGAAWDILELSSAGCDTDSRPYYLATHPTGDPERAGVALPVMCRRYFLPRLDERVGWSVPFPYASVVTRRPWRTLEFSFWALEYQTALHRTFLELLDAITADPKLKVECYRNEPGETVLRRESWGWTRARGWPTIIYER